MEWVVEKDIDAYADRVLPWLGRNPAWNSVASTVLLTHRDGTSAATSRGWPGCRTGPARSPPWRCAPRRAACCCRRCRPAPSRAWPRSPRRNCPSRPAGPTRSPSSPPRTPPGPVRPRGRKSTCVCTSWPNCSRRGAGRGPGCRSRRRRLVRPLLRRLHRGDRREGRRRLGRGPAGDRPGPAVVVEGRRRAGLHGRPHPDGRRGHAGSARCGRRPSTAGRATRRP